MARANDMQVQQYSDQRYRQVAEELRAVLASMKDAKNSIGDVFEHVSGANGIPATWTDQRDDGPPFLLSPNDVLEFNACISALIEAIEENASWPVVLQGCVRTP